jgi:DNA-binding LytR/AlgR family response regulator
LVLKALSIIFKSNQPTAFVLKPFSILIIEDEVLIAQDLKEILEEVGYQKVFRARNFDQALEKFNAQTIDLVLLDINLHDAVTGIDIANYINQHFKIPFIFITSYSDTVTINSVKHTIPAGFLLKPYSKIHLLATIEIALHNYATNTNAAIQSIDNQSNLTHEESDVIINNHLLLKDNNHFVKVPLDKILWFESDKNYLQVKTADKKHMFRCSLKKIAVCLPAADFVKCHKQFIINVHQVDSFNSEQVIIKGQEIPISRNNQTAVLSLLKG